jgi:predicted aspartyl protease
MITAKLQYQTKAKYFRFLIDSGADYTVISSSDAYLLGLDTSQIKNKPLQVEVANLTHIKAFETQMHIYIDSKPITIPLLVAEGEVECLLGRKGIFDFYDVLISNRQQKVTFAP